MILFVEIAISLLICILGIQGLKLHREIKLMLIDIRERLVRIEYNKNKP